MPDYSAYRVDLNTLQPGGGRGESPRSAFTKINELTDRLGKDINALATPLGVSDNLNDFDVPGTYSMNSNATALPTLNYPALLAGILTVETSAGGNLQVTQTYVTNPSSNPRTFRRIRFNAAKTWGNWFELARVDQAMTRTPLTAGTDANTLTTDNTWYSWTTGAVLTQGSNWPSVPGAYVSRGFLQVAAFSSASWYQRLVLPQASAIHPLIFERYGTSGQWYGWRIAGPVSLVANLPTADYGDVYVDGDGWYRWSGTAYARSNLSSASIAVLEGQALGVGQSLQNVLPNRIVGVDYTNSTGRPIAVYVRGTTTAAGGYLAFYIGVNVVQVVERSLAGAAAGIAVIIPSGWSYRITAAGATVDYWSEYR